MWKLIILLYTWNIVKQLSASKWSCHSGHRTIDGIAQSWLHAQPQWVRQVRARLFQFSSVQSLSCVWLFVTPCIAARQASLSITNSWSSLKLMSVKWVMPSSHLILSRPLLLLPPVPPSIRVFSNESTIHMNWPSQESSPTPQFKSINSLALSFLHSPTLTSIHDYWKITELARRFNPETVLRQDTLLLYNPKKCTGKKRFVISSSLRIPDPSLFGDP